MPAITSWCDKLASTPAVGVRFSHHFASSGTIIRLLAPILDRMIEGRKPKFTMESQDSFRVVFMSEDGFQYGIEPERIFVDFHHRMRARVTSAGPPIVEMISSPRPYTQLLPEVCDRLLEMAALLLPEHDRMLHRVGVVAAANVAAEEAPPGILKFVEHIAKPWRTSVDHYAFNITAQINEEHGWSDRCVHTISKPEDAEGNLVTLKFDWQRSYTVEKQLRMDTLKEQLELAQEAALRYFEELAEGDRFDDEPVA
jgi:hypothetical protein